MAESPAPGLGNIIHQLQSERQQHLDAVAVIDQLFDEYGISSEPRRRRGRGPGRPRGSGKKKTGKKRTGKKIARKKAAKKKVTKKKRPRFRQTADEYVLGLLKGGKTLTTAQVNAKWRQARRGASADNTLSKLVGQKQLKRQSIEGGRGSTYTLATTGTKKKTAKTKAAAKKSVKKTSTKKTSKKKSSEKKAAPEPQAAATAQQAETQPASQS